jgi:hypothetical protein
LLQRFGSGAAALTRGLTAAGDSAHEYPTIKKLPITSGRKLPNWMLCSAALCPNCLESQDRL